MRIMRSRGREHIPGYLSHLRSPSRAGVEMGGWAALLHRARVEVRRRPVYRYPTLLLCGALIWLRQEKAPNSVSSDAFCADTKKKTARQAVFLLCCYPISRARGPGSTSTTFGHGHAAHARHQCYPSSIQAFGSPIRPYCRLCDKILGDRLITPSRYDFPPSNQ